MNIPNLPECSNCKGCEDDGLGQVHIQMNGTCINFEEREIIDSLDYADIDFWGCEGDDFWEPDFDDFWEDCCEI